jgi:hypothetical protein
VCGFSSRVLTTPWRCTVGELRAAPAGRGPDPKTLAAYREAGRDFHEWAHEHHAPCDPADVRREYIEAWLLALREEREAKPATIRLRFAALRRFFDFAVEEEEIEPSPMARLKSPKVEEELPTVLTEDDLSALLRACSGRSFIDRRDASLSSACWWTGAAACRVPEHHAGRFGPERPVGQGDRLGAAGPAGRSSAPRRFATWTATCGPAGTCASAQGVVRPSVAATTRDGERLGPDALREMLI